MLHFVWRTADGSPGLDRLGEWRQKCLLLEEAAKYSRGGETGIRDF